MIHAFEMCVFNVFLCEDDIWVIQLQYLTVLSVFVSVSLSDVQQMQNQKEMHQKIQHSEVPSDPRAPYPFLTALVPFV